MSDLEQRLRDAFRGKVDADIAWKAADTLAEIRKEVNQSMKYEGFSIPLGRRVLAILNRSDTDEDESEIAVIKPKRQLRAAIKMPVAEDYE